MHSSEHDFLELGRRLSVEETEKRCLALSQSTTVKTLFVEVHERAENGHLSLLRNALEKNESLLKLRLRTAYSRTDVCDELSRALVLNKSVRELIWITGFSNSQEAIKTVLTTNTLLTRLTCAVDSPTMLGHFIDGLRENSSLEVLDLEVGCRHYVADHPTFFRAYSIVHVLEMIFRALTTGSCRLKSLRLEFLGAWSETMASEDSVVLVNNMVQACTMLEKLKLKRWSTLYDYLGDRWHVADVTLVNAARQRDDDVWRQMLDAVLPGIRGSCSIQALSLNRCLASAIAVPDLVAAPKVIRMLTNKLCSLVTLKMDVTMCSTEQIEDITIAAALVSFTGKLRELELRHCKISSQAIEILLTSRLTALGLYSIHLGKREAVRLLSAAMRNDELPFESLELEMCGMGNDGATAFAQAIPHCSRLKHINLVRCSIGDAGARALGDMFPRTETLKRINLGGNVFSEIGCRRLVDGLENNTSIEELTGILNDAQRARANHLTALNRAGRKAYIETTNMDYDEWFKYVVRFDSIGDLSALYFAVRSKPDKFDLSRRAP